MQASRPASPQHSRKLVCLANSRKPPNGRCIAGIEIVDGSPSRWIRPVSSRQTEEVSARERQYQDGSEPSILDIISVPLMGPKAEAHQQENWLLDSAWYWLKVGTYPHADLHLLADAPGPLWTNGHSTYNGLNDYVPEQYAGAINTSLKLIYVDSMRLHVYQPGETFGDMRRRVQAEFSFANESYSLWVTDPVIETNFKAQPDGYHSLGASYLTISLGAPYASRCYKLVATVIGANQ